MAQEVLIHTWCDSCLGDGRRVEGSLRGPFTIGRTKTVIVDLCDDCEVTHVAPFVTMLARWSRPQDDKAAVSTVEKGASIQDPRRPAGRRGMMPTNFGIPEYQTPCIACDWIGWSTSGLQYHLGSRHGIKQLRDVYGNDCPACGRSFQSTSAMTNHAMHEHEMVNGQTWKFTARMFALLRDTDPHGVVAACVKRFEHMEGR